MKLTYHDCGYFDGSCGELFIQSHMYIGPDNPYRAGDAPMSWITGSAGRLYRIFAESVFGIRAEFDGLSICPCFPSHWESAQAERIFRGTLYKIHYKKTGRRRVFVNGKCADGAILPHPVTKTVRVEVEF